MNKTLLLLILMAYLHKVTAQIKKTELGTRGYLFLEQEPREEHRGDRQDSLWPRIYLRVGVGFATMKTHPNQRSVRVKPGMLCTAAIGADIADMLKGVIARLELGYTHAYLTNGEGTGRSPRWGGTRSILADFYYPLRYKAAMGNLMVNLYLMGEVPVVPQKDQRLYFGAGLGMTYFLYYRSKWIHIYPRESFSEMGWMEKITSEKMVTVKLGFTSSKRLRFEADYIFGDTVEERLQIFERKSLIISAGYVLNKGYSAAKGRGKK